MPFALVGGVLPEPTWTVLADRYLPLGPGRKLRYARQGPRAPARGPAPQL